MSPSRELLRPRRTTFQRCGSGPRAGRLPCGQFIGPSRRRQELRERQPRPSVRQPGSRAQRYHLRRAVLPGPPSAAPPARAAADALPVAATHRAVRQADRRQPGVRGVVGGAVHAVGRDHLRQAVLRPGQHVAEPVCQSRSTRRDREGIGLVHRLSHLDDHQARSVLPRHSRRSATVAGLRQRSASMRSTLVRSRRPVASTAGTQRPASTATSTGSALTSTTPSAPRTSSVPCATWPRPTAER